MFEPNWFFDLPRWRLSVPKRSTARYGHFSQRGVHEGGGDEPAGGRKTLPAKFLPGAMESDETVGAARRPPKKSELARPRARPQIKVSSSRPPPVWRFRRSVDPFHSSGIDTHPIFPTTTNPFFPGITPYLYYYVRTLASPVTNRHFPPPPPWPLARCDDDAGSQVRRYVYAKEKKIAKKYESNMNRPITVRPHIKVGEGEIWEGGNVVEWRWVTWRGWWSGSTCDGGRTFLLGLRQKKQQKRRVGFSLKPISIGEGFAPKSFFRHIGLDPLSPFQPLLHQTGQEALPGINLTLTKQIWKNYSTLPP